MPIMSPGSSILVPIVLTLFEGKPGAHANDDSQSMTVSQEVCPIDPYEPVMVARGLRASGRFAEAIVCELRAYEACVEQEREPNDDRKDCEHIGTLVSRDFGLRAGDILEGLHAVQEAEDPQRSAATHAQARLFVATVSAELDGKAGESIPPRLHDDLAVLARRVEKLTKDHEHRHQRSEADPSSEEPLSVEAPRYEPVTPPASESRQSDDIPRPIATEQIERRRASALLGAGVGALAVGMGAVTAGGVIWRLSNQRRDAAHEQIAIPTATRTGGTPTQAELDALAELRGVEEEHYRSMRAAGAFVAIGTGAIAAGVALTAWGAVRARHSESARWSQQKRGWEVSVTPAGDRDGAGLVLQGRF